MVGPNVTTEHARNHDCTCAKHYRNYVTLSRAIFFIPDPCTKYFSGLTKSALSADNE